MAVRVWCLCCISAGFVPRVVDGVRLIDRDEDQHRQLAKHKRQTPFLNNTLVPRNDTFSCSNEPIVAVAWSVEKLEYCCSKFNMSCDHLPGAYNCTHELYQWDVAWSEMKMDYCCKSSGLGCRANCSSYVCSGDCVVKAVYRVEEIVCAAGYCRKEECCDCTDPTPSPTLRPTLVPTMMPTSLLTQSPRPTPVPSPCKTDEPTPDPTPDPTHLPTPQPTPVPTPPSTPPCSKCPFNHTCGGLHTLTNESIVSGTCKCNTRCPAGWSCTCPPGTCCLGDCSDDFLNCHVARRCGPCDTTTPYPTPFPTPFPTTQRPVPYPTPRPTPIPSLEPTPLPTPEPTSCLCNESHGCDALKSTGVCYMDSSCDGGGWRCGCREGWVQVDDSLHCPQYPVVCGERTPRPTPSPTVSPTDFPSIAPTPYPTSKVTPAPTRRPTKRPIVMPPTLAPTVSPTPLGCTWDNPCNESGAGTTCEVVPTCPNGWSCGCARDYYCAGDCNDDCYARARTCKILPTPAPSPHENKTYTCNHWMPTYGPLSGKGHYCATWNSTSEWCWVDENFDGPSKIFMTESTDYPERFMAPCTCQYCKDYTCPSNMSRPFHTDVKCKDMVCTDQECCLSNDGMQNSSTLGGNFSLNNSFGIPSR
eukprot:TRINITY_DN76345_c0_g1_i1.p1 TRINITY_DN76345_c0_g1~~TRINITY_DN76345_c0_g1_i1.p1  ORF type:complete len:640 (+),score=54.33 TRINITY_DN76345_c0_g1_i1:63-1982(+)